MMDDLIFRCNKKKIYKKEIKDERDLDDALKDLRRKMF